MLSVLKRHLRYTAPFFVAGAVLLGICSKSRTPTPVKTATTQQTSLEEKANFFLPRNFRLFRRDEERYNLFKKAGQMENAQAYEIDINYKGFEIIDSGSASKPAPLLHDVVFDYLDSVAGVDRRNFVYTHDKDKRTQLGNQEFCPPPIEHGIKEAPEKIEKFQMHVSVYDFNNEAKAKAFLKNIPDFHRFYTDEDEKIEIGSPGISKAFENIEDSNDEVLRGIWTGGDITPIGIQNWLLGFSRKGKQVVVCVPYADHMKQHAFFNDFRNSIGSREIPEWSLIDAPFMCGTCMMSMDPVHARQHKIVEEEWKLRKAQEKAK